MHNSEPPDIRTRHPQNEKLPLEGGAPRSESEISMIASGNHTLMYSWLSRYAESGFGNVGAAQTEEGHSRFYLPFTLKKNNGIL